MYPFILELYELLLQLGSPAISIKTNECVVHAVDKCIMSPLLVEFFSLLLILFSKFLCSAESKWLIPIQETSSVLKIIEGNDHMKTQFELP